MAILSFSPTFLLCSITDVSQVYFGLPLFIVHFTLRSNAILRKWFLSYVNTCPYQRSLLALPADLLLRSSPTFLLCSITDVSQVYFGLPLFVVHFTLRSNVILRKWFLSYVNTCPYQRSLLALPADLLLRSSPTFLLCSITDVSQVYFGLPLFVVHFTLRSNVILRKWFLSYVNTCPYQRSLLALPADLLLRSSPTFLLCSITDVCQVYFGLPLFVVHFTLRSNVILRKWFLSYVNTCPYQRSLLALPADLLLRSSPTFLLCSITDVSQVYFGLPLFVVHFTLRSNVILRKWFLSYVNTCPYQRSLLALPADLLLRSSPTFLLCSITDVSQVYFGLPLFVVHFTLRSNVILRKWFLSYVNTCPYQRSLLALPADLLLRSSPTFLLCSITDVSQVYFGLPLFIVHFTLRSNVILRKWFLSYLNTCPYQRSLLALPADLLLRSSPTFLLCSKADVSQVYFGLPLFIVHFTLRSNAILRKWFLSYVNTCPYKRSLLALPADLLLRSSPTFLLCSITDVWQVYFGLPLFIVHFTLRSNAILRKWFLSYLNTCPYQRSLLALPADLLLRSSPTFLLCSKADVSQVYFGLPLFIVHFTLRSNAILRKWFLSYVNTCPYKRSLLALPADLLLRSSPTFLLCSKADVSQVYFGLPLFIVHFTLRSNAILRKWFLSYVNTCPYKRSLLALPADLLLRSSPTFLLCSITDVSQVYFGLPLFVVHFTLRYNVILRKWFLSYLNTCPYQRSLLALPADLLLRSAPLFYSVL